MNPVHFYLDIQQICFVIVLYTFCDLTISIIDCKHGYVAVFKVEYNATDEGLNLSPK